MKMMKQAVLVSVLLLVFQQGAMAVEDTVVIYPTSVNSTAEFVQMAALQQGEEAMPLQISQEELAAAFESATPEQKMQVAALSGQEMKQTDGAFFWFLAPLIISRYVAPSLPGFFRRVTGIICSSGQCGGHVHVPTVSGPRGFARGFRFR